MYNILICVFLIFFNSYFRSSPGSGLHAVIFEDSLTKYLGDDIATLEDNVKADVFCKQGATIKTLCNAITHDWEMSKQLSPDIILLHIGTK